MVRDRNAVRWSVTSHIRRSSFPQCAVPTAVCQLHSDGPADGPTLPQQSAILGQPPYPDHLPPFSILQIRLVSDLHHRFHPYVISVAQFLFARVHVSAVCSLFTKLINVIPLRRSSLPSSNVSHLLKWTDTYERYLHVRLFHPAASFCTLFSVLSFAVVKFYCSVSIIVLPLALYVLLHAVFIFHLTFQIPSCSY